LHITEQSDIQCATFRFHRAEPNYDCFYDVPDRENKHVLPTYLLEGYRAAEIVDQGRETTDQSESAGAISKVDCTKITAYRASPFDLAEKSRHSAGYKPKSTIVSSPAGVFATMIPPLERYVGHIPHESKDH
jgi:hypothetical protein